MQELAIKRELDEDTRMQSIWIAIDNKIKVFSLHITPKNEVVITDHSDYTKIYSIQSLDFYNSLELSSM